MKASIADIQGKYYGTKVSLEVIDGDCADIEFANPITIWISGGVPSNRQLKEWGGVDRRAEIGNEHYESMESYQVAKCVMAAINNV